MLEIAVDEPSIFPSQYNDILFIYYLMNDKIFNRKIQMEEHCISINNSAC